MREKKIRKKDNNSHHKKNFVLECSNRVGTVKRVVINALDSKNAIRIGFNRICRLFPDDDITRARIAREYVNGYKRIEKRIG